jgi:hypothetical protein
MKLIEIFENSVPIFIGILIYLIVFHPVVIYSDEKQNPDPKVTEDNQVYRIEKPGTITFTVGIKIKGKVEKPQVMIFLPKEKPVYKEHMLNRSFEKELSEPLDFSPVTE